MFPYESKVAIQNRLACSDHEQILLQLANSGAKVDFTQGLDIRLTNPDNIRLLNAVRTPALHFAWDNAKDDLTDYFKCFAEHTSINNERNRTVYVLVNYNSTIDEDLHRIYTLINFNL